MQQCTAPHYCCPADGASRTACALPAASARSRRGLLDTDFLQLLCHVLLGTLLSKLLPFLYGDKPALLKLGSTIPYSDITRAVRRDSLLAAVGFAALGLWLSFKLAVKLFAGA